MNILPSIAQLENQMTEWRRHLHRNPELGFEEVETARFIAGKLRSFGIDTVEGVGRTGVVGTLHGRLGKGPSIGIRADMDALPMTEVRPLPYASRFPGRMHGCGHDGHTATLLGAAAALATSPDFAGTVHFIFQPAEEGCGGALAMLADGLFERFPCDEIYAFHNVERPVGQVVIHDTVVAAAATRFTITVRGKGGHAATPHLAIDPLPVAARILLAVEALPGRLTDAASPSIVTVAGIHAGEAFNTIPDVAVLVGTVRCFSDEVLQRLETGMRRVCEGEAAISGAQAEFTSEVLFAPTVNATEQAKVVTDVAAEIVGQKALVLGPPAEMGSEDFSFMLQQRPGCYFLIGQADDDHQACAHDTHYDFNDRILPIAASIWVRLVERRLAGRDAAGHSGTTA